VTEVTDMTGATGGFEGTDFFVDDTLYDDPYPYWEHIREQQGPVWIDELYNLAVITGYEEEVAVLRDHRTFSSCNSPTGPFPGLPVAVEGDDADPLIAAHRHELPMHEFMVTMDPPAHDDYRGLLWRLFTPKQLKKNEDFMWRLADEKIDEFIGRGTVEFGGEYASPFAGLVIADLLGVPEEDFPRFRAWFDGQFDRLEKTAGTISAADPLRFFEDSFERYITERRAEPRADVLTQLAQATFADGTVPEVEAIGREAAFIFAAGQETTVRLITFALRYLAENPDEQARLRRERDLIPNFLEEMLRLESPIKTHFRMARHTTTIGDVTIPAGMSVMLVNGAANRDPRQFACPAEAQIDRANARSQLAFSLGAHSCLGQSLARAESRVTIERVLDRMGDIRVSESHHGPADARRWTYLPAWLFRGLSELHLEFTPIA
jgi:cytochrome P450